MGQALVRSRIPQDIEEGKKMLLNTLSMPGVCLRTNPIESSNPDSVTASEKKGRQKQIQQQQTQKDKDLDTENLIISPRDKTLLFIELAQLHMKKKEWEQAFRYLEQGRTELSGLPEETSIVLVEADAFLQQGDLTNAIKQLEQVSQDDQQYRQAQLKLADALLSHKGDKEGFMRVQRQLMETELKQQQQQQVLASSKLSGGDLQQSQVPIQSSASAQIAGLVQLGDALVRVREVERGLELYFLALHQLWGGKLGAEAQLKATRLLAGGKNGEGIGRGRDGAEHRRVKISKKNEQDNDDWDANDDVDEVDEGDNISDDNWGKEGFGKSNLQEFGEVNELSAEELNEVGLSEVALEIKIGRTLVALHNFRRAVEFYRKCIQRQQEGKHIDSDLRQVSQRTPLRRELARLYIKLRDFSDAENIISVSINEIDSEEAQKRGGAANIEDGYDDDDINQIFSVEHSKETVADILVMGDVLMSMGRLDEASVMIQRAITIQQQILTHLTRIGADAAAEPNEEDSLLGSERAQTELGIGSGSLSGLDHESVDDPSREGSRRGLEHFIMAELCLHRANLFELRGDSDEAGRSYSEALQNDKGSMQALKALSKLLMATGNYDACEDNCEQMLRVDPNNEDALMMLADVKFRKKDFKDTADKFHGLLDENPRHYTALHKTIQLLYRAGDMNQIPPLLDAAKRESLRATGSIEPGLNFCFGCYQRYRYDNRSALDHFNLCRRDITWGIPAASQMARIYLSSEFDRTSKAGPAYDSSQQSQTIDKDEADGLITALTLIREAQGMINKEDSTGQSKVRKNSLITAQGASRTVGGQTVTSSEMLDLQVLEFYILVALEFGGIQLDDFGGAFNEGVGRNKKKKDKRKKEEKDGDADIDGPRNDVSFHLQSLEEKREQLTDVIGVPVLLGLAHYYTRKGVDQKSKTYLKSITQFSPIPPLFEEFERAYLMLAQIYIKAKKFDIPEDYCKKCIALNKSSATAHELLGYVFEQEKSFVNAAENYEQCWKLREKTDPVIGYMLAFNYMKGNRFLDAITISKQVLEKSSSYTRIKSEILERSRSLLRLPLPGKKQDSSSTSSDVNTNENVFLGGGTKKVSQPPQ
ncbi:MAG: putative Tetratricopeptide repeat protein 21B [Streblomastix strix]|uniref:Putative Tetratricopeptide repeat protein 21B n=1 Tax=Streblomastix strix TaxID=222440 RepID=A0A5J4X0D1_9EUKA|nr:MAG: putative Tetratricopeptide repeat protein 21B [Streblomastix strix]